MIKLIKLNINEHDIVALRSGKILENLKTEDTLKECIYLPFCMSSCARVLIIENLIRFIDKYIDHRYDRHKIAESIYYKIYRAMNIPENVRRFDDIMKKSLYNFPVTYIGANLNHTLNPIYMIKLYFIKDSDCLYTALSLDESGILVTNPWEDKNGVSLMVNDYNESVIYNACDLRLYSHCENKEYSTKSEESMTMDFTSFKNKFNEILREASIATEDNSSEKIDDDCKVKDTNNKEVCKNNKSCQCNKDNSCSCKKALVVRVHRSKYKK